MAKRKPGTKPGFRSLQKRYQEQSIKLRVAKSDKTTYQALIRSYRHEVALAKKKGLLDPKIDARKVKPTSNLTRQLERAQSVAPWQKTQKVSDKVAKELRQQGVEVIRNRAILSKNVRVNKKGELVEKNETTQSEQTYVPIRLNVDFEEQIHRIMANMKNTDWIAAQFPNEGMTNTYGFGTEDIFLQKFKKYVSDSAGNVRENLLRYVYLVILTKKGRDEFVTARVKGNVKRVANKRARTSLKRKEKRRKARRK